MSLNELQQIEFVSNPEQRCPCVLVVDVSSSMGGEPIESLNEGLRRFQEECAADDQAGRRVEVAVVTFGSDVLVAQDFVTVDKLAPPQLIAGGKTMMGTAVNKALDLIEDRKRVYREAGISYFRPWVFLISDGEPYGESAEVFAAALQRVREAESGNKITFFPVGVEGANLDLLGKFTPRGAMKLRGLAFVELFVWLSRSMQGVSGSRAGQNVKLPAPTWAEVAA
jgi:uncharacterized protein YegL